MDELQVYQSDDGALALNVRVNADTVWLSQAQLCELFGRERTVITKHVNNVFRDGELERGSVSAKFAHTADDGKIYQVQHYNLDVIISVGYRVKSQQGVKFRQ
ncbi:MAG: RhuM family protein [Aestuariibacter sp.]